jgi:hypothetical protein
MKLELNNKEYNIPESWDEINLDKFIKIQKLIETKQDYEDDIWILKLIEVIIDISEDELNEVPFKELGKLSAAVSNIYNQEIPKSLPKKIIIDDIEYGFVTLDDISTGEYTSIKTIFQKMETSDALPYMLTILIRPIVNDKLEKYNPQVCINRNKLFLEKLMVSHFKGLIDFFLNGKTESITNIQDISADQKEV